ncbi:MAG: helix-turn-helix domain-containing protein [Candidatus Cryptobacteroides sp.]
MIVLILYPFRNSSDEDSPRRFPNQSLKPDHIYLFSVCFIMYIFRSVMINGGIYAIGGFIVTAIILMIMYVVSFIRLDSGTVDFHFFRWPHKKQDVAIEAVVESKTEHSCMEVFVRLKQYFEDEQPYLNMDLTIYDVAHKLLTNKVYISKAVNMYADKNFCQFVNYYRIKYALDIFERDPDIRLGQLAQQSGFRTLATFNMAFKLNVNESPGEWCRRRRMQLKSSYKF